MARRIAFVLPALLVGALWMGVPHASAQSGGGCQLSGTANFKTPLKNNSANFTYSFTGALSNCQSNVSGAPTAGTISAGQVLAINGAKFQEPIPTGTGSCANGTTNGFGIVKWTNGSYTIIKYGTNSAGAVSCGSGQCRRGADRPGASPGLGEWSMTLPVPAAGGGRPPIAITQKS